MRATKCIIESENKYLVADGDGGFKSVDLCSAKSFAVVKGTDITFGWKFEDDGPVFTELYMMTGDGVIRKAGTERVDNIHFVFENKKTGVRKYVHDVCTNDGKIVTDESIGPWLTEEGVTEYRNGIEIPDGTYPAEHNSIVVRDDCELYEDSEHAAWYSEPTIDGKCETCRAKLLDLGTDIGGDKCIEVIQRSLSALKSYAECCNIRLWYDTDFDAVRAVKVPKGYKCTMDCDHEYKDKIPWELMPVVGHLDANTNGDSDYQMGLVKISEAKEGEHADR
jgi:hypothetical protein